MKFHFWNRKRRDIELNEEIQGHLTLSEREEMQSGQSRKSARSAARRELGNETIVRETTRDMWGWRWLEHFFQDVRYGLRMLRKNPGFTSVAVLTLALGIGANTAIFSLIDIVMLKMLPVQNPEELLLVAMRSPKSDGAPAPSFTNPIWEQLRDQQDVFSGVFAWGTQQFDLSQGGESHFAAGLLVSGNYFNSLGVRPTVGRLLSTSDDKRGCSGAAVLSYGFWQRQYGGEQSAIGNLVTVDSHPFQVIGVSTPGFFGTEVGPGFDVALPICAEAILSGQHSKLDERSSWWLRIMGRPKPGMAPAALAARLQILSPQILEPVVPRDWKPDMQKGFVSHIFVTAPAGRGLSRLRRAYDQPLRMLMGVVGLVLLIACANIASLMLARAATRRKEISIRLAVGASRSRLIRQLLTECILLSLTGALLGILFARWGCALLVRFISTARNPIYLELSLDVRILGFTAAIAVLTGLLFGVLPAFRSTRVSLASAMKGSESRESEGRSHFRPGRLIVACQIALSLVLLVVAGLFLRSFTNLLSLDAGFDRSNVLIISANAHNTNLPLAQLHALNQQIQDRLKSLPGVISVSQSVLTPIGGPTWNHDFLLPSGGGPAGEDAFCDLNYVSPGYFATLRSPIRMGRDFDEHDISGGPSVAIINETMARRFFPNSSPVGQYLLIDDMPGRQTPPLQIVGILKDAKYRSLREEFPPTIYFPMAQMPTESAEFVGESPTFEIRTASQPTSFARSVEEIITGVNKSITLQFNTLEGQVDDSLRQEQLLATLSGFFGGLALFLAMIGLYGVLAYMVTQRRKEIGIRMALGAGAGSILLMILRDVAILLAAGLTVGLGLSLWATRLVQTMLYELSARDTRTIALSVALLAAVALIAGYLPARRAARMDPNAILRDE